MDQPRPTEEPKERMIGIIVHMPAALIDALESLGPNRNKTIRTACLQYVAQQATNRADYMPVFPTTATVKMENPYYKDDAEAQQ